jgi:hypothetical protein
MCRLRHRVSPRRARLPRHRRCVQAVPTRGRLGSDQLQPRREELHVVHPRVSPLSQLGARDRRVHVRPGPHQRRALGHLQGHRPRPRHRPDPRRGRPGRRSRLRAAHLRARARHDRRRAGELPRGRRHVVEGDPGRRPHPRRRHPVSREPLHLLGQHHGVPRRDREWRRAHRPRRHELPVVGAAGDEAAQGGQGRPAPRAQHRPAVFQDVPRRHLRGALRGQVRPEEPT